MVRALLVRGLLVGMLAGFVAFGVARTVGEPSVRQAIALEEAKAAAAGEEPGEELVSRSVQSGLGLGLGTVVFGASLGGLFALAFAAAYGRAGSLTAKPMAAATALAGFVCVEVVPFLKYPPNPPAVGNPDTIGRRTTLWFVLLGISLLAGVLGAGVTRRIRARTDSWNAALAGFGVFALVAVLAYVALPGFNEVPADFPATVLWRFRTASLAVHAAMWATLGVAFGFAAERVLAPRPVLDTRVRTSTPTR